MCCTLQPWYLALWRVGTWYSTSSDQRCFKCNLCNVKGKAFFHDCTTDQLWKKVNDVKDHKFVIMYLQFPNKAVAQVACDILHLLINYVDKLQNYSSDSPKKILEVNMYLIYWLGEKLFCITVLNSRLQPIVYFKPFIHLHYMENFICWRIIIFMFMMLLSRTCLKMIFQGYINRQKLILK